MSSSFKDIKLEESLNPHSHITGLGLDSKNQSGLVGQFKAREALEFLKEYIIKGSDIPIILQIIGKSCSGKSALLKAFEEEIKKANNNYINERKQMGINDKYKVIISSNDEKYPIVYLSALEINSTKKDKYEFLLQKIRQSIGVKIVEKSVVIEGEVVDIQVDGLKRIVMKTADMESIFEIGEKMALELQKMKVIPGDVIRIKKESGEIIKVGSTKNNEYNYELNISSCPKGELINLVEDEKLVTLYDLDVSNNFAVSGDENQSIIERVDFDIRKGVEKKIKNWISEGLCEVMPGILIIDDSDKLDLEILKMIKNVTKMCYSPSIIFSGNADLSNIFKSSFNIKLDSYSKDELKEIIKIRADDMKISIDGEVLDKLSELSEKYSLRYAFEIMNFLISADKENNCFIKLDDIKKLLTIIKCP